MKTASCRKCATLLVDENDDAQWMVCHKCGYDPNNPEETDWDNSQEIPKKPTTISTTD